MKIKGIELINFKGFDKVNVKFNPDINVFIGDNAAGKTSFLEGILKGIYYFTKTIAPSPSPETRTKLDLNKNDIKHDQDSTAILLTVDSLQNEPTVLFNELYRFKENNHQYKTIEERREITRNIHNLKSLFDNQLLKSNFSLPIVKFYPANRNSNKNSQSSYNASLKDSRLEAWTNIYQDDNSFNKFFNWFFEHETMELRYQRDINSFEEELPELKYVRMAINIALEELSGKVYSIKSNQYKNQWNNVLIKSITLSNNGIDEKLENKSDGEKSIISLVGDIAYNLSIANNLANRNENYLHSSGIVLIDEIGGHLHPKWQRLIIPIIRKIFPNIQFFISTHSPQIISSVESDKIFYMENFAITKVNFSTKGVDTNTLLKTVFDTVERPDEIIQLLKDFDKVIENKQSSSILIDVTKKIENILNDDSGLNSADSILTDLQFRIEAYKFDLENEID